MACITRTCANQCGASDISAAGGLVDKRYIVKIHIKALKALTVFLCSCTGILGVKRGQYK